jgi:hypothetical protein
VSTEPEVHPDEIDELGELEQIEDRGRLERLLAAQPVARLIPRAYRSRRLRAAIFGLDPGSELRQTLVTRFAEWLYGGFNESGEIPRLIFADDLELYQAAELLGTTGLFRGQAGLDAALAELREIFDEVRFLPERVIAVGSASLLILIRFSAVGKGSGVPIDAPIGHVVELSEGAVTRWEIHWERADALASLGLPGDFLG